MCSFHENPRNGANVGNLDCYGDWCARLGSNQQPLPSEGSTLSIELRARMTEGTAFHIQNNGGRAAASPKQYLFSADPSTARTRPTDDRTLEHSRPRHRNSG